MIKFVQCDLLKVETDIICHQVNCQGVMGSGVAKQIRDRYPEVYEKYSKLCTKYRYNTSILLGSTQTIIVENKYIINIFAQDRYGYDKCYTDYNALEKAFMQIEDYAGKKYFKVAVPYKIGCGRGGGDWNKVYNILEKIFKNSSCELLICKL